MKRKFKEDKRTEAEIKVDEKIDDLAEKAKTAEELNAVLECMKAREDLEVKKRPKVSKETIASIAANVGIAGLILIFEKSGNIITTRVWNFISRRRV